MDAKSVLKSARLFDGFNPFELLKITEISRRRFLPRGGTIVSEGEDLEVDTSIYVISSGAVKVAARLGDSKELVVAILGSGETFGEISFIDGMPRLADVTALSDTELLCIDRDTLSGLLDGEPELARKFYHAISSVLADRLRQMNKKALEGFGGVSPADR